MENPYLFLNLDPECTDEQLEARYTELKMQYSEDRYLEGEAGRFGAENLTRLEECYSSIKQMRATSKTVDDTDPASELDAIDTLIKEGKLDEAQTALDGMSGREGRWHYLQAIVFYKRSWFTDSLRQLELALTMDPDNAQYRRSKEMLERTVNGGQQTAQNPGPYAQNPGGQAGQSAQPRQDDAMGMATCCQTLCCMNCLCDSMRCMGC